jgi:hypothetical protein
MFRRQFLKFVPIPFIKASFLNLSKTEDDKLDKIFECVDNLLTESFRKKTKGSVPTLHGCKVEVINNRNEQTINKTSILVKWDYDFDGTFSGPLYINKNVEIEGINLGISIDFPILSEVDRSKLQEMFNRKYNIVKIDQRKEYRKFCNLLGLKDDSNERFI